MKTSLVQSDLVLLMRPERARWRLSTILLTAFLTDIPVPLAPIVSAPFFFQPHLQVPQSHFRAIPATRFIEDAAQVMLDYLLFCVGLCCDLCIRMSLENERCDRPLSTGEICVSKQQRHYFRSTSLLRGNLATCAPTSQSD